jgi:Nucleotidyltransferase domain
MRAVPADNAYLANPRWELADEVAETARRRFPADVLAVGVYGSLAHGDDTQASDIDLIVVTHRAGARLHPMTRRVGGHLVDLSVIGADDYLRHARTLSTSWPLAADRYLATKPLYDPTRWLDRLRDVHLGRLAEARALEFAALAREAWCRAAAAHARAARLAEWYDTDAALLVLGEARLAAATVVGLLTRTYYRNSADAVTRTGLARAGIAELGAALSAQSDELTTRGRPVDGTVDDLFEH